MKLHSGELRVRADDGHDWLLLSRTPAQPRAQLLWLPALGVAARHYLPLAEAMASKGIATWLHEWRGHGSSSLRPSASIDWGYRHLLSLDLPASVAALPFDGAAFWLGGHSLGGQLACCLAGQYPHRFERLCLAASGSPWWRSFPTPRRWLLPPLYRFLPWLARRNGTLPGRRLGFGGTEARTLIADWARVGLSNHYSAQGLDIDLEAGLARMRTPIRAVCLSADWLAPQGSLQALLAKMPHAPATTVELDSNTLHTRADHFAWMKQPAALAHFLALN